MKALLSASIIVLAAGCATTMSPQDLAVASEWDVCKHTMGGASAVAAEAEARRRGLDCAFFYPAITAQQRSESALNFQRALILQNMGNAGNAFRPSPTVNCTSTRMGHTVQTNCF